MSKILTRVLLVIVVFLTVLFFLASQKVKASENELNLIAGKTHDVGNVLTSNDSENIYVKIKTEDGWLLKKSSLAIKTVLEEIPQTKNGNPIVGQFEHKKTHETPISEATYIIPKGEWNSGTRLYIALHVEVVKTIGEEVQQDSAWVEGLGFSGKNWATYFEYIVNDPPVANAGGPYATYRNITLTLDGSNSYDSDGTISKYEWDFDGDGTYDQQTTSSVVQHVYTSTGTYKIRLKVTDNNGATNEATSSVVVDFFTDNFNDNILDVNKWTTDVYGTSNQYIETNGEARFNVYHSGRTFLVSKTVNVPTWNTITIQGKWKFYSPLPRPTPEMTLYLYNKDTGQMNGVAYDNWNRLIRYWYAPSMYQVVSRTSPRAYVEFKLVVTKTNMQYWESGIKLKEISTTTLANATNFQLKIGGWDASSISNQSVYFDDIQIIAN